MSSIRKVVVSNNHPEIQDHLVKYGQIAKPFVRMSAGFPALFLHAQTFRRQCGLILNEVLTSMRYYGGRTHRVFMSIDDICFTRRRRRHIAKNCRENITKEGPNSKSEESNRQPRVGEDGFKMPVYKKGPNHKNKTTVPIPPVDEQPVQQLKEAEENTDNVNLSDSDETPTASQPANKVQRNVKEADITSILDS